MRGAGAAYEQFRTVVIAADIDNEFEPLTLKQVASFHVDADGTGDLAWYATQELPFLLDLL